MFELDIIIGMVRIVSVVNVSEANGFITFIWSCTNFLVLRPTDSCYPLKVEKATFLSVEA